jgi:hypothetical protein
MNPNNFTASLHLQLAIQFGRTVTKKILEIWLHIHFLKVPVLNFTDLLMLSGSHSMAHHQVVDGGDGLHI